MKPKNREELIRASEKWDPKCSGESVSSETALAIHANILEERQALALEAIQDQMERWAIGEYREPESSERTDFAELDNDVKRHPAYTDFVEAMKGRQFVGDALTDAWYWFCDGWDRRSLRIDESIRK